MAARRIWPVGQCLVCLGWGEMTQYTTCSACAKWRRAFPDRTACRRCGHVSHAGHDGLCRPCLQAVRHDDPEWVLSLARGRAVQLGFLIPGMRLPKAIPLLLPAQRKDKARAETLADAAGAPGRWRWLTHGNGDQPVSPHLINPAQLTLFQACRDWSCITIGSLGQLPSLTPDAAALLEQFHRHARARQWEPDVCWTGARSLRILLSWLGAEAPISEIDIRALASGRRSTSIRRMLQFLDDRSLVIPDPARLDHPTQRAIDERIGTLPGGLAGELCRWVRVLRGEGRRAHAQLPFATIRSYLNCLYPVLVTWADHVTSLREVTRDDIEAALRERAGSAARNLLPALRSLFRALKQERIIFRDPARGMSMPSARNLPVPIPTDQLRGLLARADGTMGKLTVALIAIHGLGKLETTRLLLADLDLPAGRLLIRRDTRRHTIYLDELTCALAVDWLRERSRRWPVTTNPHLLLSQMSAADSAFPPISGTVMDAIFRPLALNPSRLRQDRILNEAKHTADPVHLMRVFGITATPAMRYVQAAHPERRSTLPR